MRRWVRAVVVVGSVGGLAMMPPGVLLRRAGHPVNVYGELLLQVLLGRAPVWALVTEHFLISWAMAVPLVALTAVARRLVLSTWLLVGLAYGALIWAVVNSFLLPLAFGRPTPWQLGWAAIWPSVLVHLVYGVTLALFAPAWRAVPS